MPTTTIDGQYTSATIHTVDDPSIAIDEHALAQVKLLCDTEACAGNKICLMPDVHAGNVGPVGLTMTISDKIMPDIVSGDIGCGVTAVKIKAKGPIDFNRLDKIVRDKIPSGSHTREQAHHRALEWNRLDDLACANHIQQDRALCSLGTLGGGNHFIELGQSSDKELFLIVHSGSRILGQQVRDHYMRTGQRELQERGIDIPFELTWLDGALAKNYWKTDMPIVCDYARLNREIIIADICKAMKWKWDPAEAIVSTHNYVDENGTLRKGAIAAPTGEKVAIPINMKDGVILAVGKGNAEWNESAPHGSGRILKRSDVKASHTVSEFKREMKGVWSSSVGPDTLDEAPFAYRRIDQIRDAIEETVEVVDIIKPLYNFKAGGE